MATICASRSPGVVESGRPKAEITSPSLTPVGVVPFSKYFVLGETRTVASPLRLERVTVDPETFVTRPLTLLGKTTTFVAVGFDADGSSVTATFSPFRTSGRAAELPGSPYVVLPVVSTVTVDPSYFWSTKSPDATDVTCPRRSGDDAPSCAAAGPSAVSRASAAAESDTPATRIVLCSCMMCMHLRP
jgi:hypothetical protein